MSETHYLSSESSPINYFLEEYSQKLLGTISMVSDVYCVRMNGNGLFKKIRNFPEDSYFSPRHNRQNMEDIMMQN